MKRKKKEYSVACEKLLGACWLLSLQGLAASREGLYSYLKGTSDFGTFAEMPLYGSLLSLGKKRFSTNLNLMLEKGFLKEVDLPEMKQAFYLLTPTGEEVAKDYLHRVNPEKKSSELSANKVKFIPIDKLPAD